MEDVLIGQGIGGQEDGRGEHLLVVDNATSQLFEEPLLDFLCVFHRTGFAQRLDVLPPGKAIVGMHQVGNPGRPVEDVLLRDMHVQDTGHRASAGVLAGEWLLARGHEDGAPPALFLQSTITGPAALADALREHVDEVVEIFPVFNGLKLVHVDRQ